MWDMWGRKFQNWLSVFFHTKFHVGNTVSVLQFSSKLFLISRIIFAESSTGFVFVFFACSFCFLLSHHSVLVLKNTNANVYKIFY